MDSSISRAALQGAAAGIGGALANTPTVVTAGYGATASDIRAAAVAILAEYGYGEEVMVRVIGDQVHFTPTELQRGAVEELLNRMVDAEASGDADKAEEIRRSLIKIGWMAPDGMPREEPSSGED